MRAARRVPRKRLRARRSPAHTLGLVMELAYEMEEPLADSERFVRALGLIGHSLQADNDEAGEPTMSIVDAASARLADLKATWEKLLRTHRSGP